MSGNSSTASVMWTVDLSRSTKTFFTEPSGLANLARVQGLAQGDTCLARVRVTSERACLAAFDFGFSDRARVYLGGQLLYVGDNSYRSRDHRFLGTVGLHDRLLLPLAAGSNELCVAVTESFGGWGLIGRIEEREGVRVE